MFLSMKCNMKNDINRFQNITTMAVVGVGKKIKTVYAVIKTLMRSLIHKKLESIYIMHCITGRMFYLSWCQSVCML